MSAAVPRGSAAPVLSCGPRPVELHGVCVGRGASERLALAVKLARRDLQRTLLARGVAQFTVQSLPEVQIPEVSERPLSKRGETQCQLAVEIADKSAESDTVTQPSGRGEGEVQQGPSRGREGKGQQGSGEERTEIEESSGLAQLKVALSQQVQRLQELCARQHDREGGEEEEEEEREREKAAEGVSLMARKLYDLQRQVCAAQGGGRGGREATEVSDLANRHIEQLSVDYHSHKLCKQCHEEFHFYPPCRLAAAHRAATRTLHSFTRNSRAPLPSQLFHLLPQLCRDRQSNQLLALAQMYSEILRNASERTDTPTRHVKKVESKPQSKDQRKKSRKQPKQAHSTTSTSRKRMSRRRGEAGRCEGKKEPTPSQPPISPSPHSPSHPVSSPPLLPPHSTSDPTPLPLSPPLLSSVTDTPNPHPDTPNPHPDTPNPHPHTPSPHPHLSPTSSVPPPPVDPTPEPTFSHPKSQSSHPHFTPSSHPISPQWDLPLQPPQTAPLHLSRPSTRELPHLVSMTTTLSTIEEVQEMIFHKWQSTLPTPNHPSRERAVALKPVLTLGVRPQAGQCRAAGGHEWKKMERLADLLLEEVVSQVCSELQEASDELAELLYCGEFHEASL